MNETISINGKVYTNEELSIIVYWWECISKEPQSEECTEEVSPAEKMAGWVWDERYEDAFPAEKIAEWIWEDHMKNDSESVFSLTQLRERLDCLDRTLDILSWRDE